MSSSTDTQQARVLVPIRDLILKGVCDAGERLAETPLAESQPPSRTPARQAPGRRAFAGLIGP